MCILTQKRYFYENYFCENRYIYIYIYMIFT